MDEYTSDIIEDLREDVAAKAGLTTANERAITCCHPGIVAVLNHIDSLTVRLKESEGKLQAALDEKSSVYAELAKYLDLALPKVKPSCIVCGRSDYDEPAIKHMVIGSVVVCAPCRDAPSRLDALQKEHDALIHDHERAITRECNGVNQVAELEDRLAELTLERDRLAAEAEKRRVEWAYGPNGLAGGNDDGARVVEIGVSGKPRCDGTHAPPDCNDPLCWRGPIANL